MYYWYEKKRIDILFTRATTCLHPLFTSLYVRRKHKGQVDSVSNYRLFYFLSNFYILAEFYIKKKQSKQNAIETISTYLYWYMVYLVYVYMTYLSSTSIIVTLFVFNAYTLAADANRKITEMVLWRNRVVSEFKYR